MMGVGGDSVTGGVPAQHLPPEPCEPPTAAPLKPSDAHRSVLPAARSEFMPLVQRVTRGEFKGFFEVIYRNEIYARFSPAEHDNAVDFSNGFAAGLRAGRMVWT